MISTINLCENLSDNFMFANIEDLNILDNREGIDEMTSTRIPYNINKKAIFTFYAEVINIYKNQGIELNSEGLWKIKFVLTLDKAKLGFKFIYGIEDTIMPCHEGKNVPSHGALAYNEYPVSAGELYFDSNSKLIKINNQSGHLRPDFNTLKFVIYQLAKNNEIQVDELKIEALEDYKIFSDSYSKTQSINRDVLMKELNTEFELTLFEKLSNLYAKLIREKSKELFEQDKLGRFGFFCSTNISDNMGLEQLKAHVSKNPKPRTAKAIEMLGFSHLINTYSSKIQSSTLRFS